MEFETFLNLIKKYRSFLKIYLFFYRFFGFYLSFSYYICTKKGFSPFLYLNSLTDFDFYLLFLEVNFFYSYHLEIKYLKKLKIDFFKKLMIYKGVRFLKFLPIRGQRTKSNAKTRRKYHIV